jgi:copper chaperone
MEIVTLGISGMTCGGCVRSIGNVLTALDGVTNAEVSLDKANAVVTYDPGQVGLDQLKLCIEEAGFEVTG